MQNLKTSSILRIILGLMFLLIGISKLMNTQGFISFLPFGSFSTVLGWLILLSETVFGLCVLIGFRVKYMSWPLLVVLVGAVVYAVIPNFQFNAGGLSTLGFHLLGIATLVNLIVTGPGVWAIGK